MAKDHLTDPLERQVIVLLEKAGVEYIRPEITPSDPTTLDFWLPALNLYIEVKQWHSDRISAQLSKVPAAADAMVLVGRHSVERFVALAKEISK